jgi:hypothetical protein
MDSRARTLLEWWLWTARHIHQHLQRFNHRLLANEAAADRTEPAFPVGDPPIARGNREVD